MPRPFRRRRKPFVSYDVSPIQKAVIALVVFIAIMTAGVLWIMVFGYK